MEGPQNKKWGADRQTDRQIMLIYIAHHR